MSQNIPYESHEFNWKNRISRSTEYIYPKLKKMLVGKTILDLGCGNGEIANMLIRDSFDVYGADVSVSGIEIANTRNNGRFFVANFDDNPFVLPPQFSEIKFDTIMSTEVIEHLYDPSSFIKAAKEILARSGGNEIVISTPYHGYLKNLLLALFGKMDKHYGPLEVGGHIKFFSIKTISELLNENSFEVVEIKGCGRFPYIWKSMLIRARLSI